MRPFLVLILVLAAVAALFFSVKFLTRDEGGGAVSPGGVAEAPQAQRQPDQIQKPVDPANDGRALSEPTAAAGQADQVAAGPRSNTLSGLVVDGENKGVPNATVILTRNAMMGEALANEWFLGQQAQKGTPRQTTTDASGAYRFKDVDPARDYYLVVQSADFSPMQEAGLVVGEEGDFRAPDVVLREGSILTGTVADETGNPIPGVSVHLDSAYVMSDDPKSPDRLTVKTNGAGVYEIRNVAAGPRNLTAQAEGFAVQIKSNLMFKGAKDERQTQDLRLLPGHPLAGRVLVQGTNQGIGGVKVSALNFNNNISSRGDAVTKDDGSFQIDGLQPGAYTMQVEVECYRPTKLNRVQADDMNVLIELIPRAAVSGRVVDADGKPVTSFKCSARRVNTGQGRTVYENLGGDQELQSTDGAFMLCNFDPGTYTIQVTAPGFAAGFSEKFTVEQNSPVTNIVIRLGQGGSIRGRVLDGSGNPIQGAVVSSHDNESGDDFLDPMFGGLISSGASEKKVATDRQGNFELKQLNSADYQILVTHRNYTRARVQGLRVVDGQATDAGAITLKAGGSLTGKVFDQAGKPVGRGFVHLLSSSDPSLSFDVRTDAEGRYKIANVPAGTYELSATRSAPGANSDPFLSIAEQQNSRVTINVIDGQEVPRDLNLGG